MSSQLATKTSRHRSYVRERNDGTDRPGEDPAMRSRVNCLVANMTISVAAARHNHHYTGGILEVQGKPAPKVLRPNNTKTCSHCTACMN